MKWMKRAIALLLCLLMLTAVPVSVFATDGAAEDPLAVSAEDPLGALPEPEICAECGGVDSHTDTCSQTVGDPVEEDHA